MAAGDERDPYDLDRFVQAQADSYAEALAEVRAGAKRSHWMWYVFPQFDGLGSSSMARKYAIGSESEARAYLEHPVLGPRLLEIAAAVLRVEARTARQIFGGIDELKLRSCMTLYAAVSPPQSVFEQVLAKYFGGAPDARTLELLSKTAREP
jgi:uncharacterized protein (DUF1810 family)